MTTTQSSTPLAGGTRQQSIRPRKSGRGFRGLSAVLATGLMIVLMTAAVAASAPIQSTELGEMPTTGGLRPGPIGLQPAPAPPVAGELPVSIQIPKAQVNAEVETIEIVDGVMQNPTGPWVVSWYKETAKLGEVGNTVMAGHLDYWDVGPSVFYHIGDLAKGDKISITGNDGDVFTYEVDWVKLYDATNAPIQTIVGPTKNESLTLITCGGPFDYQNGVYLQRMVVRAHLVNA
jgi:LPXTG-site transpeptidase (sortase) family protein